jgi:hypothetical protein
MARKRGGTADHRCIGVSCSVGKGAAQAEIGLLRCAALPGTLGPWPLRTWHVESEGDLTKCQRLGFNVFTTYYCFAFGMFTKCPCTAVGIVSKCQRCAFNVSPTVIVLLCGMFDNARVRLLVLSQNANVLCLAWSPNVTVSLMACAPTVTVWRLESSPNVSVLLVGMFTKWHNIPTRCF